MGDDIVGRPVYAVLAPPQAERFAAVADVDPNRLVLNVTGCNKLVRETLTQSAADSRFIRHDLDALFGGDFMHTFGLDRCYEELQTVTELAHDLGVPFQLSETVSDVYRRAVRRYGSVDGELLMLRSSLGS